MTDVKNPYPPGHEEMLRDLRATVLKTLGVNGKDPNPLHILDHAVAQACLELEALADALIDSPRGNGELGYTLAHLAERLELARSFSEGRWHPDHPELSWMSAVERAKQEGSAEP